MKRSVASGSAAFQAATVRPENKKIKNCQLIKKINWQFFNKLI
jgi:hypothetical protein